MLVKVKVGPSKITGMGLFADQFIAKGTRTWEFTPGFDLEITPEQVAKFPPTLQEFIHTYSYVSPRTGNHILPADDERFTNHSDNPNTRGVDNPDGEGFDIATRDIAQGEEITANYRETAGPIDFEIK